MTSNYSETPKFVTNLDLDEAPKSRSKFSQEIGIDFENSSTGGFEVDIPSEEELQNEERDSPSQSILRQVLKPIYEHLIHPNVEEIAINRPGELWLKVRKPDPVYKYWVPVKDERLTKSYLHRVCGMMANTTNTNGFGPEGNPVVYGVIPGGHRFAGGVGYNIQWQNPQKTDEEGSICICVRQYITKSPIGLKDYNIAPGQSATEVLANLFNKKNDPNDLYAQLYNSLDRGDHILISGATSTGKTQLLNRIVSDIDIGKRIVTVEDTREIVIPTENRVHILMSRTTQNNAFTYQGVRDLIVRLTPDIVMAGEISNSNAATIWDLMTSGHGHFMTTIHAESPDEAITTFINCIAKANAASSVEQTATEAAMRKVMLEKLRIIQIKKDPVTGRRVVTAVR